MTLATKKIIIFLSLALALPLVQGTSAPATEGWLVAAFSRDPAWPCGWGDHSWFRTVRVPYNAYDPYTSFGGPYEPSNPSHPYYNWYQNSYNPSSWPTTFYMHWESAWTNLYPPIPEIGNCANKGDTAKDSGMTYLHRRVFVPNVPDGKIIGQVRLKRWSDNNSAWYINGTRIGIWGGGYPGDGAGNPSNPLYIDPTLLIPNYYNLLAVSNFNDNQDDPNGNPVGIQYYLEYTLVDAPKTDVVMNKYPSPSTYTVAGDGSIIIWKLSVSNNSAVRADNLVVEDTLPSGLTYHSVSGSGWSCSYNSSTRKLTCSRSSLGAWAASTIDFKFVVPANFRTTTNPSNATVTNTASVTTSTPESNTGNNSDSATLTVGYRADVQITKTDSSDPVYVGDEFSYNLMVSNNGPSIARNKIVQDTLPAGLDYLGKDDPSNYCSYTASTRRFQCNIPQMVVAGSANYSFRINVRVQNGFAGSSVTNTATVTGGTTDPVSSNNSDSETTTIRPYPDLRLVKTVSKSSTVAGDGSQVQWQIAVHNDSPTAAPNVVVSDQLPSGLTYVNAWGSGWSCSYNTSTRYVTCSRSSLAGNGSAAINIAFTVPSNFRVNTNPTTTSITNTASVSSDLQDANPDNNSDSATLEVTFRADVQITKTDSTDPVYVGDEFSYTLAVRNNGPSVARNKTVQDTLPAGLDYVGKSDPNNYCSYTGSTRRFECSIPRINVGASYTFQINVRVRNNFTGSSVTNTATVTGGTTDPGSSNNSDSETTTVLPVVDLRIRKSDTTDPVIAGNQLTWDLLVENDGPSAALNPVVVDTLPPGVTVLSATVVRGGDRAGWSCASNDPTSVVCSGPTIQATSWVRISITVEVHSDNLSHVLNNCAEVSNDVYDRDLSNNTDCEPTTLTWEADLSIVKEDDPDPVAPGSVLTYTLSVRNDGPSDAYEVVVWDSLPTIESSWTDPPLIAFNAPGWSCSYDAAWEMVSCARPHLAAGETAPLILIMVTIPVHATSGQIISNEACVESDTHDPYAGNNCDAEETEIDYVVLVGPPTGFFFAHVRHNADIDPSKTQKDFLPHEYIPGHLQVPVAIGFGYEAETAPILCLSNQRYCQPEQTVYGRVIVNSYRITEIRDEEGDAIWTGDIAVEMNRYATVSATECGGSDAPSERCIAKDLHTGAYAWRDPGEYVFVGLFLDKDLPTPECGAGYACIFTEGMVPGLYEVRGAATLTVVFPGYPEFEQYYRDLPITTHLQQAAPRIMPDQPPD